MKSTRWPVLTFALVVCFAASTWDATACYVCLGDPDAPMSKGMTVGIFSLLAVIGTVLVGVASFFIYLAKRGGPENSPVSNSTSDLSLNNTDR